MPASPLVTRNRLLLALLVLVLVGAAVWAAVTLASGTDPAAGAAASASPTATSGTEGEGDPGDSEAGETAPGAGDAEPGAPGASPDAGAEANPEPRETLDPAPFDAEVTPEPGVTVTIPSVEQVTGEANLPGEVGGPALRFAVELTNGTDEVLDLRTVVVNAYYGPDRTPATPLLKPGGKAFEEEVAVQDSARGVFVFAVPPESQGEVELEVDAGVGAAIVIFADS